MAPQPEPLHARAGMIASEFSLIGMGAAVALVALLAAALQRNVAMPIVRPALATAAGLSSCGLLAALLTRYFAVGVSPAAYPSESRDFAWFIGVATSMTAMAWWGTAALGDLQAVVRGGGTPPHWPVLMTICALITGVFAIATLAILSLRALAALQSNPLQPVGQMLQACGHTLLAGLGLITVIAYSADLMSLELRYYLGTAMTTTGAHTILWSAWILRGSRRARRQLLASGVRVPMLERGHRLATAALLLGLILPCLVILVDLVAVTDVGLPIAGAVLAASNHAMRYGLVLLPVNAFRHLTPPHGQTPSALP